MYIVSYNLELLYIIHNFVHILIIVMKEHTDIVFVGLTSV
jgi:hypothetical protein